MTRLAVRKTYKLWIGGAFVRSESGRYDEADGLNFPRASRKDVRDAVVAARTAYNRGQILYRAADPQLVGLADRKPAHRTIFRYGRSPAGPPSRPNPDSL